MRFKKAFTMAEAILVMTILGIIATIMISTLKPAQYKEQAFQVLSKSIYAEIDSAMTQILTNHTQYNRLGEVYPLGSTTTFSMANSDAANGTNMINLLKKYMATARGTVPAKCTAVAASSMLLKNGACIAVVSGSTGKIDTWIPGELSATNGTYGYGKIFLDINGDTDPNVFGKDQFVIPLVETGIVSGD